MPGGGLGEAQDQVGGRRAGGGFGRGPGTKVPGGQVGEAREGVPRAGRNPCVKQIKDDDNPCEKLIKDDDNLV